MDSLHPNAILLTTRILPSHMQKVAWQTLEDHHMGKWRQGHFESYGGLYLPRFVMSPSFYDITVAAYCWMPIEYLSKKDAYKFSPEFRVGKKQGRAVLDGNGYEVVVFPKGQESMAEHFCDFLNKNYYNLNI